MAKKTNKTDHVLSLLSKGMKQDAQKQNSQQEPQKPPVDPAKKVSEVSVVHSSKGEEDPVADAIKDSLEEEFEKTEAAAAEVVDAPQAEEPKEDIGKTELQEEKKECEEEKKEVVTAAESPEDANETEGVDYEFVNVMEYVVQNKVLEYMEKFGNCTCHRCVADTSALALTHLPAKYVVVNKNAVSPLLNFYANKYSGQVTVEITKACIQVQNNPHH